MADGLRTLVIPLTVYHLTGSGLALGITYALEYAPYAIFSTVGGSLADRIDRRTLMIACDGVRFAIMLLFAVALGAGMLALPLVYAGMTIVSIAGAIFVGGQSTSVPFLVGPGRVGAAVATLVAAEEAGYMVAPPIGGVLFALCGPLISLASIAAVYLASMAATAALPTLGPDIPGRLPTVRELAADTREGFAFIARHRTLALITWVGAFIGFFSMLGYAAIVPYLKLLFTATDAQVGVAFGMFSLAAVVGALLSGRFRAGVWTLLTVSLVIDTLSYIPIVFGTNVGVAVGGLALSCAMSAFELAVIMAWRLTVIPQAGLGRVIGAVNVIALGGTVPGAILGGWLCDHGGPRTAMLVAGLGYLVCLVAVAFATLRRLGVNASLSEEVIKPAGANP